MRQEPSSSDAADGPSVDRRGFIKYGSAAAAAIVGGPLLAACGSSGQKPSAGTTTTTTAGAPKRGGVLTVGVITNGSAETLNPASAFTPPDIARVLNLYDTLYDVDANLQTVPSLAESGEPNRDATIWTFRLRSGVHFHNGKPLTADDVIATLKTWADPSNFANGLIGNRIDTKNLKKLDRLTVRVPLLQANARLPQLLSRSIFNSAILPGGVFTKTHPVGTGPFMYKSFTPAKQSVFERNPNYFRHGTPYVDQLVIDSSFTDDDSLVNALLGNQIQCLPTLPFSAAKQQAGSSAAYQILHSPSSNNMSPYMRVDTPPFDDPAVRQALRLVVDRPTMVEVVYNGYGTPLSDVMGNGCQFFARDLVRHQDVEQAKFLLKKAGKEGLTITMRVSNAAPGGISCGTLFQQNAAEAGIKVNLTTVPAADFFNTSTGYLTFPFAQAYYDFVDSMQVFWAYDFLKNSPAQETHWHDAKTDKLFAAATGELDDAKAASLWRELQQQQFDSGGYIVFGSYDNLDGLAKNVRGLTPSRAGNCDMMRFANVWLA